MNKITNTFYSYISDKIIFQGYIAGFDLDWTLIRPNKGKFPKVNINNNYSDIVFLPNVLNKLLNLQNQGYTIVIFSNQKVTNFTPLNKRLFRINSVINILESYNIHPILMISLADDDYRKPKVGMWNYLFSPSNKNNSSNNGGNKVINGFYCGDAAGRSSDFSDSDLEFLNNINRFFDIPNNLKFYIPEELF